MSSTLHPFIARPLLGLRKRITEEGQTCLLVPSVQQPHLGTACGIQQLEQEAAML